MAGRQILVVEDDSKTAAMIRLYLEHAGFVAQVLGDGHTGLEAALSGRHHLIILDVMLPGVDGITIARRIREQLETPIIMLTARTTEDDRVRGLDLGADDYIPKPFSPRELIARIHAVLRRTDPRISVRTGSLSFEGLTIDLDERAVHVRGSVVSLTPTEFTILQILAKAPNRVFTRDELIERGLGHGFEGQDRTIDAHVMNLRRKIEADRNRPDYILTVFGVGYRFGGKRTRE